MKLWPIKRKAKPQEVLERPPSLLLLLLLALPLPILTLLLQRQQLDQEEQKAFEDGQLRYQRGICCRLPFSRSATSLIFTNTNICFPRSGASLSGHFVFFSNFNSSPLCALTCKCPLPPPSHLLLFLKPLIVFFFLFLPTHFLINPQRMDGRVDDEKNALS